MGPGVIVHAPQIVAIRHRGECSIKREDLHPVPGQIQFSNDLRTEKGHDVRRDGEFESRKNFFGDRRAAEHMPALADQNVLACSRQVCGVNKTVMSATDHNDIVFRIRWHSFCTLIQTGFPEMSRHHDFTRIPVIPFSALLLLTVIVTKSQPQSGTSVHTESSPPPERITEGYGRLPMSFEPNVGQTDPQFRYVSRGSAYDVYMADAEVVFEKRASHSSDHPLRMKFIDPARIKV